MDPFEDVNSPRPIEVRIKSYDGWQLVLIAGFDLCYSHSVELIFTDVERIDCPTGFEDPHFFEAGACFCGCKRRRFAFGTEDAKGQIIAYGVEIKKVPRAAES